MIDIGSGTACVFLVLFLLHKVDKAIIIITVLPDALETDSVVLGMSFHKHVPFHQIKSIKRHCYLAIGPGDGGDLERDTVSHYCIRIERQWFHLGINVAHDLKKSEQSKLINEINGLRLHN